MKSWPKFHTFLWLGIHANPSIDFTIFRYQSIKITWLLTYWLLRDTVRLHQRYFERVGDLNQKIWRFFKDSFKSDKCLINYRAINVPILRLSVATQLSIITFPFPWIQFSSFGEQMYLPIQINKGNECVIDFYRLIDTIEINQITFTDFYWLSTPVSGRISQELNRLLR